MPPGNRTKLAAKEQETIRAWIDANAESYPRQFDEAYVLNTILADVRDPKNAPHVSRLRYFSLAEIIPDDASTFSLADRREAFRKVVAGFSKNGAGVATTVDPSGTVFRV